MDNPFVEISNIPNAVRGCPAATHMTARMREVGANNGHNLTEHAEFSPPILVGVPRLPVRVVARPRVTGLLDDLWPSGVTAVRGGTGAGKTIALVSWLHSSEILTGIAVWHTIDSVTARRAAFWQRLHALVGEARADGRVVTSAVPAPPEITSRGFRHALVSAVATLGMPLTLVLDEFDQVADEVIVDDLAYLAAATPQFRIVAASRMPSGFETPRRAIGLDTRVVTENDLAFTQPETREVLERAGASVGPTDVDALTSRLYGWPAGIRVSALAIEASNLAGGLEPIVEIAETAMIAYVRNILFTLDALKPGLLTFLKKTSIVDDVVPELARALTGADDSAELLEFVEQMGVASRVVCGGVPLYRYGNIATAALATELADNNRDDTATLHARAARWYEANGNVIRAFAHAVESSDGDLISTLIERHRPILLSLHAKEFRELVQNFSEDVLWRDPTLVTMLAVAYHAPPVASDRLIDLFSRSTDRRERLSSSASAGEKLALNAVCVVANRFTGEFEAAVVAADELIDAVSRLTPPEETAVAPIRAIVCHQAGLTHRAVGNLARATECFASAWNRRSDLPAEHTPFHIAASSALCWALGGDVGPARSSIEQARECDPTGTLIRTHGGIDLIIAEALVAAHAFNLNDAAHTLAACADDAAHTESLPIHAWAWATVLGLQGEPHGALDVLDVYDSQATAAPTASVFARSLLASVRATTFLRLGLAIRAQNALADSPCETQWTALARTTIDLLAGDNDKASRMAVSWVWRAGTYRFPRAALLALKAAALLRRGDTNEAGIQFRRALSLIERSGAHFALAAVPQRDLDALVTLVNTNAAIPSDVHAMPDSVRVKKLSAAELRVLEQLADTSRIDKIAGRLFITRNTVKGQLRSVYRKLDASGRSEALETAYRFGLLAPCDYAGDPRLPLRLERDIGLEP